MSAKELKDRLKSLRSEFGKPITKMTAEEMAREIAHHETAKRSMEVKAKRLEALTKAREARTAVKTPAPKVEAKPEPVKPKAKSVRKPAKKVEEYSEASSTDHDSEDSEKHETIKSRIQKK